MYCVKPRSRKQMKFERLKKWWIKWTARQDLIQELIRETQKNEKHISEIGGALESANRKADYYEKLYKQFLGEEKLDKTAVMLVRHILGSIDQWDAHDRDPERLEGTDRKNYLARLASNYDLIKKIIRRFIVAQEQYAMRAVDNEKTLMFSRGTTNGLMLLEEELENAFQEHMTNTREDQKRANESDKVDPAKLFPIQHE